MQCVGGAPLSSQCPSQTRVLVAHILTLPANNKPWSSSLDRAPTRVRAHTAGQTVMLQNANGFVQLSLFKSFDGTFSEGGLLNGVGILGARSTSILWTYSSYECCRTSAVADAYFQRRLYMKVFPMAYV